MNQFLPDDAHPGFFGKVGKKNRGDNTGTFAADGYPVRPLFFRQKHAGETGPRFLCDTGSSYPEPDRYRAPGSGKDIKAADTTYLYRQVMIL